MMKALIAMSGGVDSSVAALLAKEMGYDCVGCTMRLYNNEDVGINSRTCCSLNDVEDARSVAYSLGMPYYVFNFSSDFGEKIIKKFVDSYFDGATPNPCIDCNRYMKFEKLYDRAMLLGCEKIVSGHYARIEEQNGRLVLKKAVDQSKDQSYVLYMLSKEQLSHTLFPLGGLTKAQVRAIAEKNGFINSFKPDSQDICFVPNGDYASVIEKYSGKKSEPGYFIDGSGKILGEHKGIIHYTVGQRKGLGIASSAPLFVTKIDPQNNTVTLTHGEGLFTDTVTVRDINLTAVDSIEEPIKVKAKIRYRHTEQSATVVQTDSDTLKIKFDSPQRAVTRGQAAVLYDGDTVLGGGTIV
ncbi:MAG: tRNA 2-thiouridine(34) synthase MnmA [Oscillospiraceae bacterium]|nr:tRNA 2-thiouridine(34) synthase MnmA [Oscillospiraceae bacterium]